MIIEFRSHSITEVPGSVFGVLTDMGKQHAYEVGRKHLRGKSFTHAVAAIVNPISTAEGLLRGMGEFNPANIIFTQALMPEVPARWIDYCTGHENRIFAADDIVAKNAVRMAQRLTEYLDQILPDEAHLLLVADGPNIQAVVYGLTKVLIQPLKPCEGVKLAYDHDWNGIGSWDDRRFSIRQEFRLNDPRSIVCVHP